MHLSFFRGLESIFFFYDKQLLKVVNQDENSWTPTETIKKRSLRSDGQVDRVDLGPQRVLPLATYVKEILSKITITNTGEMITPA